MKQIIVMRTDLNMRKGKMIAQGAHASMGAVVRYLLSPGAHPNGLKHRETVMEWLSGPFTKICVRADSEEELRDVAMKAEAVGIITCVITDAGKTEFAGEPTITCCAIGPDTEENLQPITGELKLL